MKNVRKTKEERDAIKKFKAEEKSRIRLKKERKPIQREHIYLIFAFLILILLISILIYMLFFSKSRDVIVPDLPTNETMDIGVIDFSDAGTTSEDLNSKKNSNISVSYNVVSDFYKEGILLSNTQALYLNNSFIITSGYLSTNPFISSITKDGNLSWITKLDDKEYGNIRVEKTIFLNNNYYVFASAVKNDKTSLIVIKLNNNGKKVTTRVLKNDSDVRIKDAIVISKKIAIITSDSTDVKILFTDEDLKDNKNEVVLSKYVNNSSYLNYQTCVEKNGFLDLVVNNPDGLYNVEVDINTYSATANELSEINNLKSSETIRVANYLKGFVSYSNSQLYKLNENNKLINKIDYSKIKLEDDTEYREKYKDNEEYPTDNINNIIEIEGIKTDKELLVVKSSTMFSTIYDIYDSDLKISKRIMLDKLKYTYENGVLLNSFYEDGNIYEVYSYGAETPSIMISKIG